MPLLKQFICADFVPGSSDGFVCVGLEDEVIEKAADHVVKEHGYIDSPELREDIRVSLVNAAD